MSSQRIAVPVTVFYFPHIFDIGLLAQSVFVTDYSEEIRHGTGSSIFRLGHQGIQSGHEIQRLRF